MHNAIISIELETKTNIHTLEIDLDYWYEDDSFSHGFGTEHGGHFDWSLNEAYFVHRVGKKRLIDIDKSKRCDEIIELIDKAVEKEVGCFV